MRASPRHANEFLRATADVHDALRHTKTTKMRLGSGVPPGLGLVLSGCPRVALRSTLGYFRAFPPGTLRSEVRRWSRNFQADVHGTLRNTKTMKMRPGSFAPAFMFF